jgi:hypothetical protein
MLPLYLVAAAWSLLRGGDPSSYNVFEVRAGLADGGYVDRGRRAAELLESGNGREGADHGHRHRAPARRVQPRTPVVP